MSDIRVFQHVSKLAIKACFYSRDLWEMHFLSLERNDPVDLERLWLSHSTALQSRLSSAEDYSAILTAFLLPSLALFEDKDTGKMLMRSLHGRGRGGLGRHHLALASLALQHFLRGGKKSQRKQKGSQRSGCLGATPTGMISGSRGLWRGPHCPYVMRKRRKR